jgi:hypothetical protein
MAEEVVLTPERVEEIFRNCKRRKTDAKDDLVRAEGQILPYGFSRTRLDEHCDTIRACLAELPNELHESTGIGGNIRQAHHNSDGTTWTDERIVVEHLIALGTATGMVRWLYPNSWRTMFECGLPVFVINI